MDGKTHKILADNVKKLMNSGGVKISQDALAESAGIAQTTVSNLLRPRPDGPNPTIATLEAVAKYFRVELWHLMLPELPDDLLRSKTIEKLVNHYSAATPEGRANLDRIAESEARYTIVTRKDNIDREAS